MALSPGPPGLPPDQPEDPLAWARIPAPPPPRRRRRRREPDGVITRLILAHPGPFFSGFGFGLVAAAAADIANPVLPVALPLAAAAALLLAVAFLRLRRRDPDLGPSSLLAFALPWSSVVLVMALVGLARSTPHGILAPQVDAAAALQDVLRIAVHGPPRPGPPAPVEELRASLAAPATELRRLPVSAEEVLHNALVLHRRGEPPRAAQALADALRRGAAARPDALLLHDALLATGVAAARDALAPDPAFGAAALAHVEAMRAEPGAARLAALAALAAAPDPAPATLLALTRLLAEQRRMPTVATAGRVAALADRIEAALRPPEAREAFLDPAGADRLLAEARRLGGMREAATRRLSVTASAPPPELPDEPVLLRIATPEPATAVQRRLPAGGWAAVPAAGPTGATLRLPRPWQPGEIVFRYLDEDGIPSPEVTWRFDPAALMRQAALRAIRQQGVFALYLPMSAGPGRVSPLLVEGHHRPGLAAVEWWTDADRQPRRAEIGVPDAAVLAGRVPRTQVDFPVPPLARTLLLVAVFFDGSRSVPLEVPLR